MVGSHSKQPALVEFCDSQCRAVAFDKWPSAVRATAGSCGVPSPGAQSRLPTDFLYVRALSVVRLLATRPSASRAFSVIWVPSAPFSCSTCSDIQSLASLPESSLSRRFLVLMLLQARSLGSCSSLCGNGSRQHRAVSTRAVVCSRGPPARAAAAGHVLSQSFAAASSNSNAALTNHSSSPAGNSSSSSRSGTIICRDASRPCGPGGQHLRLPVTPLLVVPVR